MIRYSAILIQAQTFLGRPQKLRNRGGPRPGPSRQAEEGHTVSVFIRGELDAQGLQLFQVTLFRVLGHSVIVPDRPLQCNILYKTIHPHPRNALLQYAIRHSPFMPQRAIGVKDRVVALAVVYVRSQHVDAFDRGGENEIVPL